MLAVNNDKKKEKNNLPFMVFCNGDLKTLKRVDLAASCYLTSGFIEIILSTINGL